MVSSYETSCIPRINTSKSMSSESTFASIIDLGNVMINSPLALASIEISKDAFSESISKFKTSPPRIL